MPGIILVHSFVDATVECKVVFVAFKTSVRAEDTIGAWLLVDPCADGEVVHLFHFAGAQLEEGCALPGCGEIWWRDGRH